MIDANDAWLTFLILFQVELLTVELQEARDQNELLEFRILELEGCQSQTMAAPVFLVEDFVRSTRDAETELELVIEQVHSFHLILVARFARYRRAPARGPGDLANLIRASA